MPKYLLIALLVILALVLAQKFPNWEQIGKTTQTATESIASNPLSIETMRKDTYPGSDILIEREFAQSSTYTQYIASYKSQNLKINALLTIPKGEKPADGWPVIVFNHGYIPPANYRTTERYGAYVDTFAANGYIVFKPDYRGHGESEGEPEGAYYSPAYAIDILNAVSSIKNYKDANPEKIGMWGHSLGGNITLRNIEVSPDIKAAVIWAGVVGSYDDLMNNWRRTPPAQPNPQETTSRSRVRTALIEKFKMPKENPTFWNALDPFYNLNYVTAPVQLHHGEADETVPVLFSQKLADTLKSAGKTVEIYTYPGADHDISQSFNLAAQRSLEFFGRYLK